MSHDPVDALKRASDTVMIMADVLSQGDRREFVGPGYVQAKLIARLLHDAVDNDKADVLEVLSNAIETVRRQDPDMRSRLHPVASLLDFDRRTR